MCLTHSGVCAVVWLWAIHSIPGEPGTRILWIYPARSHGRDLVSRIRAPTLLVCGLVEVCVGSRGEVVRSGVFLYTSVEVQHHTSSKRVTSVGPLQHLLALERPHQYSSTVAMTTHHDSYSPLATPVVRSSDTMRGCHRGQDECNWNIALFASTTAENNLLTKAVIGALMLFARSCPRIL